MLEFPPRNGRFAILGSWEGKHVQAVSLRKSNPDTTWSREGTLLGVTPVASPERLGRLITDHKEITVPDLFEQLKQKYQPVLDMIQKEGAQLQNVNLDGKQLFVKATATSEASKNRIWNAIKVVDPSFTDLKHDIDFRQTNQSYTVQAGDTLSKISKHFYGDANKYARIAEANKLPDPDKIKVGQELIIPAA